MTTPPDPPGGCGGVVSIATGCYLAAALSFEPALTFTP